MVPLRGWGPEPGGMERIGWKFLGFGCIGSHQRVIGAGSGSEAREHAFL